MKDWGGVSEFFPFMGGLYKRVEVGGGGVF
jgi:hypothetical protein